MLEEVVKLINNADINDDNNTVTLTLSEVAKLLRIVSGKQ